METDGHRVHGLDSLLARACLGRCSPDVSGCGARSTPLAERYAGNADSSTGGSSGPPPGTRRRRHQTMHPQQMPPTRMAAVWTCRADGNLGDGAMAVVDARTDSKSAHADRWQFRRAARCGLADSAMPTVPPTAAFARLLAPRRCARRPWGADGEGAAAQFYFPSGVASYVVAGQSVRRRLGQTTRFARSPSPTRATTTLLAPPESRAVRRDGQQRSSTPREVWPTTAQATFSSSIRQQPPFARSSSRTGVVTTFAGSAVAAGSERRHRGGGTVRLPARGGKRRCGQSVCH